MYQNYLINSKLPLNVADAQIVGVGGGEREGGGGLPCPCLKIEKFALMLQKVPCLWKKCSFCVHLWVKFSFKTHYKSISEVFPAGSYLSMSYMKRLSNFPYFKKPPLPWKIPCCAHVSNNCFLPCEHGQKVIIQIYINLASGQK